MNLQERDPTFGDYERPADGWRCGRAGEGRPCRRGPDAEGRCRTRYECSPARAGGGWKCTRSAGEGGPCPGPLPDGECSRPVPPCIPVRGRGRRSRLVARTLVLAALGLLIVALGAWRAGRWISPGPLSRAHGTIADCASCHPTTAAGPSRWAGLVVGRLAEVPEQGCLSCHDLGERPRRAHGRSAAALAALAGDGPPRPVRRRWTPPVSFAVADRTAGPPCATCHAEHGGRDRHLIPAGDRVCAGCHFGSFRRDHPPLAPRIDPMTAAVRFDHRAHFARHFVESKVAAAPERCSDCHRLESGGRMGVRSFQATCARCHQGQLDGSARSPGDRALPLLPLPGLDVESLAAEGFDAGSWPFHAEWPISPLWRLLLAAGPQSRADLEALEGRDLLDLSTADPEAMAAATRVARAIKEVLDELARSGPQALVARLEEAAGRELPPELHGALLGGLSRESVLAACDAWFPELAVEVARFRSGAPLRSGKPRAKAPKTPAATGAGPGAGGSPADDDLLAGGDGEGSPAGGDEDLLSGGGEDLLAGGGDEDLLSGGGDDDLLAGGDDLLAADVPSAGAGPGPGVPASDSGPAVPSSAEDWPSAGGFLVQDFALRYRPANHPDPVLEAWLDLLAELARGAASPAAADAFARWADRTAPGACGKCHPTAEGRLVWRPQPRPAHGFTRFAHSAHLGVAGEAGCFTCHRPAEPAPAADAGPEPPEAAGASGFQPLERALCIGCHARRAVGETCTLCHRYHPDPPRPVVPPTPIGEFARR